CIFAKDLQGKYLFINRQFEELFHLTREEIRGRTDPEVFPEPMARVFQENDRHVALTGEPLVVQEDAPHDDGPHTYVSVKCPLFDAAGACKATCGIATDITGRRLVEAALQERQQRLQVILETAVEGIITTGEDKLVEAINPAAVRMFGYEPSE